MAVRESSYPPSITCAVTYNEEWRGTGRPTKVGLHISGMDPEMEFQCTAYERIQGDWNQLVTAPIFYKCSILWQLFLLNMPTDAKECRENNWYCTVYTYKYRGKHVYMYSTSLEHNVTLENLHAYCYCMLCFSTSLADKCLLVVGSNQHTYHSCVVPRTPAHTTTALYCSP